ncbi:Ribonuclease H2 subunit A [Chlorella vulgaris]
MEPEQEEKPAWYQEACHLGIDEAGRGPVLGPMVYAVAFAPISRVKDLKAMGFADSKTLSEEKRERLYSVIQAEGGTLGYQADVLSAALISGKMLGRDRVSLNALAFDSTCALIEGVLGQGVNLAEAYIDALGDTSKHRDRLSERFPGVRFVVEAKADATYPIVSAASIVAKVTRDRALRDFVMEETLSLAAHAPTAVPTAVATVASNTSAAAAASLAGGSPVAAPAPAPAEPSAGSAAAAEHAAAPAAVTEALPAAAATQAAPAAAAVTRSGVNQPVPPPQLTTAFGSGYPGDPDTRRWLEASIDPVFGFPSLVRFSWATCKPLLDHHAAPVTFECDADDAPGMGQQLLSFGSKAAPLAAAAAGAAPTSSGAGRHSFFRARKLQRALQCF